MESIREWLPEHAKDIRVNLQLVMETSSLSEVQRWGVAVATAAASRQPDLCSSIITAARQHVPESVVEDALAAAVLMGMNNVYYRFRHLVGKETYSKKRAGLRMQRLAQPATGNRLDFEVYCLAVSAVNACEACIRAHEQTVVVGGLSDDQVHDAVRIAAVIHAAAVAFETRSAIDKNEAARPPTTA